MLDKRTLEAKVELAKVSAESLSFFTEDRTKDVDIVQTRPNFLMFNPLEFKLQRLIENVSLKIHFTVKIYY